MPGGASGDARLPSVGRLVRSTVNSPPSFESRGMPAKIVQGRNTHFVCEAFVGFNVVFSGDQRVHVLKRAADLQGPVTFGGQFRFAGKGAVAFT